MKKLFLGSFLALSLLSNSTFAQAPARVQTRAKPAPAAKIQQGIEVPFVNKKLANGLEVIVLPDASVPLVTVEMAVRNGSFTEPPELNGLSHLYEHMFFKTNDVKRRVAEVVQQVNRQYPGAASDERQRLIQQRLQASDRYLFEIDNLGITYNGTTREEVVNYYFTTTSPNAEMALKIVRDSIRYPTFDENELAQEKEVVIGELDRQESNPFYYLDQTLKDKLFYKYPTRKKPGGTRETVSGATTEKMRLIQSRYYVPNNSALVVTGNVKPEDIFKLAEQNFGDWQPRAVDPFKEFPLVEHPPLIKSEGIIVEQPVQNILIQIGWHGPSIGKDDKATYAADVFSYILSQPDSRFQRNLVDSGLTVGVSMNYYTQRNVGPITILLVTTPDKAKTALEAVYKEVAEFDKPNYFSDTELENAKTILESRDLFDREQLSEYAHTLSFWWSSTGIEYFRGYHRNLRATSRADINNYVKTYIQGKPHVGVALLSSETQAQAQLTAADLIGK